VDRRNERSPGGPVLAGAVALLIFGFLALVTLAAAGGRPLWHGQQSARPVPHTVQDSVITLVAIAYAVPVIALLVMVFRRWHRWNTPDSHWLRNSLASLAVMGMITGIGYLALTNGHLRERGQALFQQARQGQAQPPGKSSGGAQPPERAAHFQWPLALGLGGLVLLAGVWILVKRHRRLPEPISAEETVEQELAQAIGSTIDDLRGERDARRAVIAAYANMERILALHDLARRRAEVPHEYLARVLRLLNVRESAARELTELFEYARFSDHEVDLAMKESAIEALVVVKEDLEGAGELAA
jgi:uncharacterized membrane protein YhaH (DUF805 family)